MNFAALPRERQIALIRIAIALWQAAWGSSGGVGQCPSIHTLSAHNQQRWIGAAIAAERLMAEAKNDAVHQTAVINTCIRALEALRDTTAQVKIPRGGEDAQASSDE